MSMNIKDAEAHRLARELTAITGETLTQAVRVALEERLSRVQEKRHGGIAERLQAIRKDAAPRFKEPYRSIDHADLLYDEHGLPR